MRNEGNYVTLGSVIILHLNIYFVDEVFILWHHKSDQTWLYLLERHMCCSLRRHGTHENYPASVPWGLCITSRFTTLDTFEYLCSRATHLIITLFYSFNEEWKLTSPVLGRIYRQICIHVHAHKPFICMIFHTGILADEGLTRQMS
jgi:hypothetical protein